MSEEQTLIEKVQAQIAELQRTIEKKKAFVNELCSFAEIPPIYELSDAGASHGFITQPDAYYGKATATALTIILEKRKAVGLGAATINEIYDELCRGGFRFDAKSADNAKRGLTSNMNRNPKFHRLPNGTWGLREWYENVREGKKNGKDQEKPSDEKPLHEELQEEDDAEGEQEEVKVTTKAK